MQFCYIVCIFCTWLYLLVLSRTCMYLTVLWKVWYLPSSNCVSMYLPLSTWLYLQLIVDSWVVKLQRGKFGGARARMRRTSTSRCSTLSSLLPADHSPKVSPTSPGDQGSADQLSTELISHQQLTRRPLGENLIRWQGMSWIGDQVTRSLLPVVHSPPGDHQLVSHQLMISDLQERVHGQVN